MMGWGNMMGGYGPGYYGNGNYWWMGLMGSVIPLVLLIAVVAIVWHFVRKNNSHISVGHSPNNNALDILRERYAKGEIDSEEYTRRKENLLH